MMRFPTAVFLSLCLALPALAQDDTPGARSEAMRAFVATEPNQQLIAQMFSPSAVMPQVMSMLPPDARGQLTRPQVEDLARAYSTEASTLIPTLELAMVRAGMQFFTLAEIEALTTFYASPEGASAMAKLQPFMGKAIQSITPQMQAVQSRLVPVVAEMLDGTQ